MSTNPETGASKLVGTKPGGKVRPVSLAVKHYLDRYRPGGVVVAVSGGADSLALAVATIDIGVRRSIPVSTVTVDHGIRPGSAAEADSVRQLLGSLGASAAAVATAHSGGAALGPEGDARDRRYGKLRAHAQQFAAERGLEQVDLLLGHTLDDQAETVLLRLGRGAGSRSLSAMSPRYPLGDTPRVWLGRPLLELRRQDTENFCAALNLPVVHDPTNRVDGKWRTAADEPLRRAAVREWALPALKRSLGQDAAPGLARTARSLREDNEALDFYAGELVQTMRTLRPADTEVSKRVEVLPAQNVPGAVRLRAWRLLALESGALPGELLEPHLRAIDLLATDWRGRGPVQLPGHVTVSRVGEHLHFQSET